jgi:hypothetical protein
VQEGHHQGVGGVDTTDMHRWVLVVNTARTADLLLQLLLLLLLWDMCTRCRIHAAVWILRCLGHRQSNPAWD